MGTYVTDVYGEEFTPGRRRKVRPVLGLVTEPAREVPVLHDVDVLVVGGGPGGSPAAISAARRGARGLGGAPGAPSRRPRNRTSKRPWQGFPAVRTAAFPSRHHAIP